MKPCIYLKEQTANKITSWLLLVSLPFFSLAFLVLAIVSKLWQSWALCAVFGLLLCFVAIPGWLMNTRTYRITEWGIEVGGLLRRVMKYSWSQVHGVGIYAYGATASMNSFRSGLFIFLKPIPDYFAYDVTKGYFFLARQYRRIIVIDYSQPVLDELLDAYTGEIHDHRPGQKKMHESR